MARRERSFDREKRIEQPVSDGKERAAVQGLVGEWKAFLKGDILRGGEIPVRPMGVADIDKIIEAIGKQVDVKERTMTRQMDESERESNADDVVAEGESARKITGDTTQGLKGQVDLVNFLYNAFLDGVMQRSPEIFMVSAASVDYLTSLETPDMTTADLGSSVIGNDVVNNGIQFCMVVTEKKGSEIMALFQNSGHKVFEHASGSGFQTEIGGVRMAFLYPAGQIREVGATEVAGFKSGGTYGKEYHA